MKLTPEQEETIATTIGNVEKSGASLMAIAQDTPELRFSALNVAKEFSDDGLAVLKPVAGQLKWVDLARTQLTDKGLAHLAGMKGITRLHLENTKVTDAGLDHIKGLEDSLAHVVFEAFLRLGLVGVHPRYDEDRMSLCNRPADKGFVGVEIEHIEFVDPGGDDEKWTPDNRLCRRLILDELAEIVLVNHLSRRRRHIFANAKIFSI